MNLSKLYYDPQFPGSYGGALAFHREVKKLYPTITRKQVYDFLKSQPSYTLHKPVRRPKKFRKTIAYGPRDLFQIDLLDYQKYSQSNKGFRYVCVIIDVFTKYVWVKPLKNKTGSAIVKALALLLMTERPRLIQVSVTYK